LFCASNSIYGILGIIYSAIDTDGNGFPFDVQFDLVFVANVMHHIERKDLRHVLSRIKSSMKRSGLAIIFEFNPYNPATQLLFKAVDRRYDPNAVMLKPHYLHSQLKKAGFAASRAYYTIFFPAFVSILLPLEKYMTGVPIGAQYYMIAENKMEAQP